MIALWAYHWRNGRTVERLFLMARFDRTVGAEQMRESRADLKFCSGEQWSTDEMMIMRRRL